jgi:replicative DNA helicase
MTGINNTNIQTGNLTQAEAEKIRGAKDYIAKNSKFYSAKPREGTIDEIIAIIDEYRFKHGIEVVFWDYIQLIVGAVHQNGMNREQIIGSASKVMKHRVTEDMGLAAIVIAQLNRDKESKGKQKVSGSYQIMQDCDDAILIDVKTKKQIAEDGDTNGNRYIQLEKRRGGVSDVRLHAFLDASEKSASLRLIECGSPKSQSIVYGKVMP